MKTLLLAAVLTAATSAVAAPAVAAPDAPATQTAPAVASAYDELVNASRAQFEAKDFAGAQKTVEQMLAIAKTPKEKSEALRRLGQTFDAQEQYDKARETWKQALTLTKDSPSDSSFLNLMIGQTYYKQENWQLYIDAALPLLDSFRADEGATKSAFRIQLGEAYSKLGQQDKAREQLALVVQDETLSTDLRGVGQLNLAENYRESDEDDKARPLYEALTKIPEVSGDLLIGAYRGLGEIAQKQNRADDAKSAFDNARSLWMQKADGQYKAKDWNGAIASYKHALETGVPENNVELVAHLQLGQAYQETGDNAAAVAEFKYIADTEPDASDKSQPQLLKTLKPLALMGLAKGYIAQKQFEPARAALNKFMGYADDLPAMLFRKEAQNLLKSLPPQP